MHTSLLQVYENSSANVTECICDREMYCLYSLVLKHICKDTTMRILFPELHFGGKLGKS